jgi:hypothetical protein
MKLNQEQRRWQRPTLVENDDDSQQQQSLDGNPKEELDALFRWQELTSTVFKTTAAVSSPSKTIETSCSTESSSSSSSSSSNPAADDADHNIEEPPSCRISLPEDVETSRISIYEDDECSANVPEGGPEQVTMQDLVSRIQVADKENSDLVRSNQDIMTRFNQLLQEYARQSVEIARLERQAKQQKQQQVSPEKQKDEEGPQREREPPRQIEEANDKIVPTRSVLVPQEEEKRSPGTTFFRKLLQSDAQQLKQMFEGKSAETERQPISPAAAAAAASSSTKVSNVIAMHGAKISTPLTNQ